MRQRAARLGQRLESQRGPFHRARGIGRQPLAQRGKKQRLAVGRALAVGVKIVGDQRLGRAPPAVIAAELAVVHEGPAPDREGMAIVAAGRGPGRGTDMGHEQARLHRRGQAAKVRVGPGGQHVAVKPRIVAVAVPGKAEAVRVHRRVAADRGLALPHQRMRRQADDILEIDRLTDVSRPATHVPCPIFRFFQQGLARRTADFTGIVPDR